MRINIPGCLIPAFIAMLAAPVSANESQAERILEMSRGYTAEWNCGRMKFSEDIPGLDEATGDELELLDSLWLPDTLELIGNLGFVRVMLPERITLSMLRTRFDHQYSLVGFETTYERNRFYHGYENRYICPLTSRYPRLNSEEYSKGNFFMFALDDDERSHVLNMLVAAGTFSGDQLKQHITDEAVYYRLYGESGVLVQGILWAPGYDMWGNSFWDRHERQQGSEKQ